MITTIQIYIKEKFPNFYKQIRQRLFPLFDFFRAKKRSQFNAPTLLSVRPLNVPFFIKLDPQNGFIDQHIFATGSYEPDILGVIKKHLAPGDTFIDIGGNIGWHTLFAASLVGEAGEVHTFEPISRLREQLTASIKENSFTEIVKLYPFGCGEKSEELLIHLNPINIGGSSILDTKHKITTTINLKTGDEVLSGTKTINLIKIDTEGFEVEVLRGLKETLKNKRPKLIIEYSPSFWQESKLERGLEFFTILTEANYQIFDLEDGYFDIKDWETWVREFNKLQTNLLCLPK